MPEGHPNITLPAEAKAFLDELAQKAADAPEDMELWKRLAEARVRASNINPAYRTAAQHAIDHILERDENDADGLRMAGNLAYDHADYRGAETFYKRYLAIYDDDPSALTDLGTSILFQGRVDEAIEFYRKAVALKPDFVNAYFNLGIALKEQGDQEGSLEAFNHARESAKDPAVLQRVENAIARVEGREPVELNASTGDGGGQMPPDHPPVALSPEQAAAGLPPGHPPMDAVATAAGQQIEQAGQEGAAANAVGDSGDRGTFELDTPEGTVELAISPKPAAPVGAAPSNASSDFQREIERMLLDASIVGQRIDSFQWSGVGKAKVFVSNFQMDGMPQVLRNKFKSTLNEKIAAIVKSHSISDPMDIHLIDKASGRDMDKLDGKEWIGFWDESKYQ